MSQRDLDERIRQAFSALTSPPRPQLTERIRDSLWSRPAPRAPLRLPVPLPPPLAVLVAGLVIVALVAALLVGPTAIRTASAIGRGVNGAVAHALTPPRIASTSARRPSPSAHASPTAAPTQAPTPTPEPTPTATPVPTPTAPLPTLPGYSCATQTGGGGQATMSTARVGVQNGYDRFVIQFAGPVVPQWQVALQGSASFTQNGGPVTLPGGAGLQVTLQGASGGGAFSPGDLKPGFAEIQEARVLSDSGGQVQWGVSLAHAACFHAWVLPSPSRLVIDVAR